MQKLLQFLLVT